MKRYSYCHLRVWRAEILAALFIFGLSVFGATPPLGEPACHLLGSFRGNGEDGLHLAYSTNRFHWEPLCGDRSVIHPTVGESKLMRDPCLIQGPDGAFHLVWTTSWTGKTIGYASSKDLVHWSEQIAIPVMAEQTNCKLCWAPEVRYDAANRRFLIYWSSSLTDEKPEYWRTYATTTTDFKSFEKTRLFFDPGHSQIDASILEADGRFHLFYKHSWQGIRYAAADKLEGPYGNPSALITDDNWEGPFPTRSADGYLLYADRFKSRDRMGLWFSKDLTNWSNVSQKASFPPSTMHCSVLAVDRKWIDPLIEADPLDKITPPEPILEGFTADPHAVVFDDTYYVYPTSDKSEWQTTDFSCWSSKDLIHWKNEGLILDVTRDLKWAKIRAWAPGVIRRDGKYYFYFCAEQKIGVAVSDKPIGKFTDALDRPLITPSRQYPGQTIDPCPFLDDDGQAYLYYGQGNLYAYKLKPDMITLDGNEPMKLTPRHFNEGVFVFKRQGLYYFMWSENDARSDRYQVAYGTSRSPLGPIEAPADNVILQKAGRVKGTGHHAVVQVPGTDRWYIIYHRHAIPNGNGYTRQTCLARMEFTEDGRIRKVDPLATVFPPGSKGEPIPARP